MTVFVSLVLALILRVVAVFIRKESLILKKIRIKRSFKVKHYFLFLLQQTWFPLGEKQPMPSYAREFSSEHPATTSATRRASFVGARHSLHRILRPSLLRSQGNALSRFIVLGQPRPLQDFANARLHLLVGDLGFLDGGTGQRGGHPFF